YDVEVMGLDVGVLEVAVHRRGAFMGAPVTELRSEVKVNKGIASLVPLEAAAAALIDETSLVPVQASHRYRWMGKGASEMQHYGDDATVVASRRIEKHGSSEKQR